MPLPPPQTITLKSRIPNDAKGKTLLGFLCQRFRYHTEDEWRAQLAAGRISLDGTPSTGAEELRGGMRLRYEKEHREPPVATDFRVLHHDDILMTVDKPAHIPMHADGPFIRNTLISLLRAQYGDDLHLVHRLDRETSGICVLARSKDAVKNLHEQFQANEVQKVYVALVHGVMPAPIECRAPIGHRADSQVQLRRSAAPDALSPKSAETRFEPIRVGPSRTLVRCLPATGRTHQIRAHLEHLGHPIVGDKLYGHPDSHYLDFVARMKAGESVFDDAADGPGRQLLHAHQIVIRHPANDEAVRYEATVPPEFERWLLS